MTGDGKKTLAPRLRFPEFRNAPGWDCSTIGDVSTILKGKGLSKADLDPQGKRHGIRYAELYTRYGEVINAVYSRTNAPDDDLFLSEANDVIIPASGETKEDIATASCVLRAGVALGSDLNVLRTSLDGVFLSYYINGRLRPVIAKFAQGDTVVHLYPSQLKETVLAVPSPFEQRKIAACLSSLDDLIRAEVRKLEALRSYKKGLMQQLFPRPGESRPRLRFSEFHKSSWVKKTIGDVLQETSRPIDMDDNTEYELVTVKRRYGGVVARETLKGSEIKVKSQFLVEENDFLISKRQIVHDACGLVPASRHGSIVSNEYSVLTPREKNSVQFFNYFAQQPAVSKSFLDSSVGIVIEKMLFKLDWWLKHEFLFPSPAEQQRIAACLSSLDAVLTAQSQKLEALKAHKKGLMQQLFPSAEELIP